MRCLRALAHLLAYPSQALLDGLSDIEAECRGELGSRSNAAISELIDELRSRDLLSLQERYVSLFDSTRSLSLHLFEHVHGDARERGNAMVTLQQMYAERGLEARAGELPDYLPALCEFASLLEPDARQRVLQDAAGIFTALRARLEKRRSAYAAPFAALLELAARAAWKPELRANLAEIESKVQSESVAPISERGFERAQLDEIDRVWEESAVEFGPGAPQTPDRPGCGARGEPLHSIAPPPGDPARSPS